MVSARGDARRCGHSVAGARFRLPDGQPLTRAFGAGTFATRTVVHERAAVPTCRPSRRA